MSEVIDASGLTARLIERAAHELANPLQAATIFAELLAETPLPPEAAPLLDRVRDALRSVDRCRRRLAALPLPGAAEVVALGPLVAARVGGAMPPLGAEALVWHEREALAVAFAELLDDGDQVAIEVAAGSIVLRIASRAVAADGLAVELACAALARHGAEVTRAGPPGGPGVLEVCFRAAPGAAS